MNIGLANQFARFADTVGVDITKVIEACNTQPYSHIHQPGIAVGGHCIPVYPRMYLWNDPTATVVSAAREANAAMPDYAVGRLAEAYGDLTGAHVLVLGASYRGGVKETAFSGVFPTVEALRRRGAHAYVSDPMYTEDELVGARPPAVPTMSPSPPRSCRPTTASTGRWARPTCPGCRVLVDGRRVTDPVPLARRPAHRDRRLTHAAGPPGNAQL